MGWVAIGTTAAGMVFAVVWWLVRRRVSRLDALEAAVFGDTGVNHRLHKYVTREEFQREITNLSLAMRGISEEGVRREERILKAIEQQTQLVGTEVRDLKADVREQLREVRGDLRTQTQRVDEVLKRSTDAR